ncbi:hypothetical protein SLE2022_389920 [Rubroshorea leprosula]
MATNGQQKRQVNRHQQGQELKKLEKRKLVFVKKGQAASQQPQQSHIAECLVGDETGTILFTARNDQVDLMKPNTTDNNLGLVEYELVNVVDD